MPFKKTVQIKSHHEAEIRRKATEISLTEEEKNTIAGLVSLEIKPVIIRIAERAFRQYCKQHKADEALTEMEWNRFKKIMERML